MMKHSFLFFLLTMVIAAFAEAKEPPRSKKLFTEDWKFFLGDNSDAKNPAFDDSKWRKLDLPHDWSIEGAFSESNPATPAGGALPTGMGWYRKSFTLSKSDADKLFYIEFDGVYRNSEVWINGHYLGKRPNGYISFRYELTPYLHFGRANVIAVKVDNSEQPNSRWYTGSGIYRNVWLVSTNKTAIAHWGTFISTPKVSRTSAEVNLKASVINKSGKQQRIKLRTTVFDASGKKAAEYTSAEIRVKDTAEFSQNLHVEKPVLWSVSNPYLYKAVTKVISGKKVLDEYRTPLGIRYFHFDAEKGFFLNGEHVKIQGVCNHHDLGALGAAVNVRAMERQLEIMKEMGVNGLRTAHNPPAPELLELCDKMGFIVMDEAFDVWAKKKMAKDYHMEWDEWHTRDLEDLIKRDRNHPSIFMWSIGNEIREQFDSTGIAITKELVNTVKRLDNTRPVLAALTETDASKNFMYQAGALDIYGLNYNHKHYADFPKNYPGQILLGAETTSAMATRGYYDMPSDSIRRWPKDGKTKFTEGNKDFAVSAYDNVSAYWGSTHEETWKEAKRLSHVSGIYVWTGFDYLGEPTPYPYPARSSYLGIVDLAGFPKDSYYMYQSEWTNKPVLHVFPHWNWEPGKIVDVWAYYNQADEVELFLNGRSQGTKRKEGDELHVMWRLPFEPGTLKAVSRRNGKEVLTREIKTTGKPARIELIADRDTINADAKDLSFVTVKVLDKDGNVVPYADNLIRFSVKGSGFIAGVDNGFQASIEPFKANYRKAYHGLCLAIVQSDGKHGEIILKAEADGLDSSYIKLLSK